MNKYYAFLNNGTKLIAHDLEVFKNISNINYIFKRDKLFNYVSVGINDQNIILPSSNFEIINISQQNRGLRHIILYDVKSDLKRAYSTDINGDEFLELFLVPLMTKLDGAGNFKMFDMLLRVEVIKRTLI